MPKKIRFPFTVTWNSPFVLSYAAACAVALLLSYLTHGKTNVVLFSVHGHDALNDPLSWLRMITHACGHVDTTHLMANFGLILLVGPLVEEKYGTKRMTLMALSVAFITGLLHTLLFSGMLLGASGIAFMIIILSSLTNARKGTLPLTFILVTTLFIGSEVMRSFESDQVSQFAHIIGGICGAAYGFWAKR